MLRAPEEKKKISEWKKVFEEIMTIYFPNSVKDINLQMQETQGTSNRTNPNETIII